jgi:tRNA pseudouridine13 synthase
MLKNELDKALDLIMSPRDQEKGAMSDARLLWLEKKDPQAVLDKLPKSCAIERRLMQGMLRTGSKSLQTAFESIPR